MYLGVNIIDYISQKKLSFSFTVFTKCKINIFQMLYLCLYIP